MNQKRLATYTCYVAFIILGTAGTLLGPSFQSLTTKFAMPLDSGGIFTALQFAGITVAVVVGGRLLDRMDARNLLLGGLLFLAAGLLLIGGAPLLPLALCGAALLGIGYGLLTVAPNVVIAALNPDRASAALSALNTFYGIGAILGPQTVNFALKQQNYAIAFFVTAAIALMLLIPFAFVSVRLAPAVPQAGTRWVWITLLPFAILLFCYVGSEVGYSSWIFTQMRLVVLSTESMATLAASIFWAGLTAGRFAASLLLRYMSDTLLLLIMIAIIAGGVIVLLLFPTVEMLGLILSFVVGFGCGPIFPIVIGIASDRYPEARGTISGILIAIGASGGSLLPVLQGKLGAGLNGGMVQLIFTASLMFIMGVIIDRQKAPSQVAERIA
jgi:fucose permease